MTEPLADEAIDQERSITTKGSCMLFCRAALPLSSGTLDYAAGIIRRHRVSIGFRWRKLPPSRQAMLALVYLRKGETFPELAAGFGVGATTVWRYAGETVALLAARTPKLRKAVRDAERAGHAYVILHGTLIPVDRVAADRPFYPGKHKKHGMNLQVIASPRGDILWVSGALPGSVHDKRAEWIWGVLDELEKAGLVTLADKGYQGSTWAKVPYKGKNKPEPQKEALPRILWCWLRWVQHDPLADSDTPRRMNERHVIIARAKLHERRHSSTNRLNDSRSRSPFGANPHTTHRSRHARYNRM